MRSPRIILKTSILFCALMLAIAGCNDHIGWKEGITVGKGLVQLTIDGNVGEARTVLPAQIVNFIYDLTFTADGKQPVTHSLTSQTNQIELEAGVWNLDVSAKLGPNPVGTAHVANINVEAGKITPVSFRIAPHVGGPNGTFTFNVDFNTDYVTQANLTMSKLDGASPRSWNLIEEAASGSRNVASGSWLVRAILKNEDPSGTKTFTYTEIVHIYSGLTTALEWEFYDDYFVATRDVNVSVTINTGIVGISGVLLQAENRHFHGWPMNNSGGDTWTLTVPVPLTDDALDAHVRIETESGSVLSTAKEVIAIDNDTAAMATQNVWALYGAIEGGALTVNGTPKTGYQIDVLGGLSVNISATPHYCFAVETLMGSPSSTWTGAVNADTQLSATFRYLIDDWAGQRKTDAQRGTLYENNMPNNVATTFTGDPATTRTISWQSKTTQGEVIINGVRYPSTVVATTNGLSYHRVDITGLEPGLSYEFIAGSRIGETNFFSPKYSFKTVSAGSSFYIIQITDPQLGSDKPPNYSKDAAIWKRVIEKAVQDWPNAAFIVNTGDIIENAGETQLPYYFDYAQDIMVNYPFLYSMGNNDALSWYNKIFFTPGNNYANGFLYSFDYGNAHFVNFTNQKDQADPALNAAQLAWLEDDLASTDKKWKVALTHQGSRGKQGGDTPVSKLFQKYGVRLVMSGHNHIYARSNPVNSAGSTMTNGTVWCIPNAAGSKFNSTSSASWLAQNKQPNLPMFSVYEFTATNIVLKAYTVSTNGTASQYDTYTWQ